MLKGKYLSYIDKKIVRYVLAKEIGGLLNRIFCGDVGNFVYESKKYQPPHGASVFVDNYPDKVSVFRYCMFEKKVELNAERNGNNDISEAEHKRMMQDYIDVKYFFLKESKDDKTEDKYAEETKAA